MYIDKNSEEKSDNLLRKENLSSSSFLENKNKKILNNWPVENFSEKNLSVPGQILTKRNFENFTFNSSSNNGSTFNSSKNNPNNKNTSLEIDKEDLSYIDGMSNDINSCHSEFTFGKNNKVHKFFQSYNKNEYGVDLLGVHIYNSPLQRNKSLFFQ